MVYFWSPKFHSNRTISEILEDVSNSYAGSPELVYKVNVKEQKDIISFWVGPIVVRFLSATGFLTH